MLSHNLSPYSAPAGLLADTVSISQLAWNRIDAGQQMIGRGPLASVGGVCATALYWSYGVALTARGGSDGFPQSHGGDSHL